MRTMMMAAALALLSAIPGPAKAAEPIRIGSFLSVTGQGAFLGDPSKKVLELFVDRLNMQGGLLGRPVELVLYDSKTSAKEAVTFARRLIDQDRVDLIIGGNSTGEAMAVVPFVEAAGVPFIALAGGSVVVDPPKPFVFKTPHTDRISVEKIFQHAAKAGRKRPALLSGQGGFDQSCRTNTLDLAAKLGVPLATDQQHGNGDTDMTPQMTSIRRAEADFLIYCGFGAPSSIVAKNHRQLLPDLPLYMTVGAASKEFVRGAQGAAEGAMVTASAILVADKLPAHDPQRPVAAALSEEYAKAYSEEASTFAGHAYDAFLLATDAIRRAGGSDRKAIREALERTDGLAGINGIYRMKPADHMGLEASSLKVVVVRNGDFAPTE